MTGFANTPAPNARARWVALAMVGLVAVVGGLFVPQLITTPAPPAEPRAAGPEKAQPAYTPPSLPDGPSPQSLMIRLLIGTAVVLGLCVGTLWVGKRWLAAPAPKAAAGGQLSLVETLPLGNRCSVHLVKVGSRQVLVGVDGAGVKSMVALPEQFGDALEEIQKHESFAAPLPPRYAA
jgi:flagellar biogenesis protein FliO